MKEGKICNERPVLTANASIGKFDFSQLQEVSRDSIEAKLFQIIDDIDTATDIFKPDNKSPFVQYCYKKIKEARLLITSDGYKLYYQKIESTGGH